MWGGGWVWQVRLHLLSNGYIVMASLLVYVSVTHTHAHKWQKLDHSFQLPLTVNFCQIFVSLRSPSVLVFSRHKGEHAADWQSDWSSERAHNSHTHTHICRHTLAYMMSRLHLPWQPNNESHWHSSPLYLSPGRLEKCSRLCDLGALFFSFSLCRAFTFKSFSSQPHSQSLNLECLI